MRLFATRILIALVVLVNLQCAGVFILSPSRYAVGFELSGLPGEAAVRGFGVLFVMWSIPYLVALYDPVRFRSSLYEALVMQGIGLVGEIFIYQSLPDSFSLARSSILRFILFDAAGLVALILAACLSRSEKITASQRTH